MPDKKSRGKAKGMRASPSRTEVTSGAHHPPPGGYIKTPAPTPSPAILSAAFKQEGDEFARAKK